MDACVAVTLKVRLADFALDVDLTLPGSGVTAIWGPSGNGIKASEASDDPATSWPNSAALSAAIRTASQPVSAIQAAGVPSARRRGVSATPSAPSATT